MNRIVIIGNGFDLAHGLKSSYGDFLCNYMTNKFLEFINSRKGGSYQYSIDPLFNSNINLNGLNDETLQKLKVIPLVQHNGESLLKELMRINDSICGPVFKRFASPFFYKLCDNYASKGWVNIEATYYDIIKYLVLRDMDVKKAARLPQHNDYWNVDIDDLNNQLDFLAQKLIEYLRSIQDNAVVNEEFRKLFFSEIHIRDIAVTSVEYYYDFCESIIANNLDCGKSNVDFEFSNRWEAYDKSGSPDLPIRSLFSEWSEPENRANLESSDIAFKACIPEHVMLLNFNYTNICDKYKYTKKGNPIKNSYLSLVNIHGRVDGERVIFGYGDELDNTFHELESLGDNRYLKNIKSINYLESADYRKVLTKISSKPYQVYIIGHSCGTSDRTLLNTILEHPNCASVKIFYHKRENGTDDFRNVSQNISRNFNDKQRMRDLVVNKTHAQPIPQSK